MKKKRIVTHTFDQVTTDWRKVFIEEITEILSMLCSDFTPVNYGRLTAGVRTDTSTWSVSR